MLSKLRTGQTTFILEFPVWWPYALSLVAADGVGSSSRSTWPGHAGDLKWATGSDRCCRVETGGGAVSDITIGLAVVSCAAVPNFLAGSYRIGNVFGGSCGPHNRVW